MLSLGIETIVVLLLIVGIVSAFGGYVVAQERARRAGGGKSAAELKTELGEYKESVDEHFRTTAGLLHDMTEQYRAVYEHMAAGAQSLCDPETARSQIESLRAGLLPSAAQEAVGPDSTDRTGDEPDEEPPGGTTESDDDAQGPCASDDSAPAEEEAASGTESGSGEFDPQDEADAGAPGAPQESDTGLKESADDVTGNGAGNETPRAG